MTDTTKIDPEAKAVWLPALDSGTFPQCTGSLYDGHGYCCLGVFAKAKGATFVRNYAAEANDAYDPEENPDEPEVIEVETGDFRAELDDRDIDDNELLSSHWAQSFGITDHHQQLLSHLNDGGELTMADSNPLIEVARDLCEEERPAEGTSALAGHRSKFRFKRHSFAEIAAVIREYF